MNTYEKHRGEGGVIVNQICYNGTCPEEPAAAGDEGSICDEHVYPAPPLEAEGSLFILDKLRFRYLGLGCRMRFGIPGGLARPLLYALASSFNSALPLRNHGRSRLCMYRGSVRFFA